MSQKYLFVGASCGVCNACVDKNQNQNQNIYCRSTSLQGNSLYAAQ